MHVTKYNTRSFMVKKLKKIPVQIYLDTEQQRIIGLLSKTSGKSRAAIIRSCISDFIASLPLEDDPALNIINLGALGTKDIAEKHDDYLVSLIK